MQETVYIYHIVTIKNSREKETNQVLMLLMFKQNQIWLLAGYFMNISCLDYHLIWNKLELTLD